jgi:hypothetical protein
MAMLLLGPVGAPAATCTTIENVAVAEATIEAMVQETAPVPPTGGLVHVNEGPVGCDSDTNVVFGGRVSDIVTLAESEGPLFVTVML